MRSELCYISLPEQVFYDHRKPVNGRSDKGKECRGSRLSRLTKQSKDKGPLYNFNTTWFPKHCLFLLFIQGQEDIILIIQTVNRDRRTALTEKFTNTT